MFKFSLLLYSFLILFIKNAAPLTLATQNDQYFDDIAIKNFQEYLRIPSVHPDINYDDCINFLRKQAQSLGLLFNVYAVAPKKPVAILTWVGLEPNLPAVLLNSHMDVVPVYAQYWTHDPFGADIDENGDIYGRGAQDTKSVGIEYLEAIRRLKSRGILLKRTVHVSFVPDEETGGSQGMEKFVETADFRSLNIGVALDEGLQNPTKDYIVVNGDRTVWQFRIHCPGQSGHGSLLLNNTAGEKVRYLLDKFYNFREGEIEKLKSNSSLKMSDVTTINLTGMKGGVEANVIPAEFELMFDCRIAITVDMDQWEEMIYSWLQEAGEGVWIEYIQKQTHFPVTKLDDSNPYWVAFKKVTSQIGMTLTTMINVAISDARFLRKAGIPVFGFSPMNGTVMLAHDNDERLNKDTFLKGIEIYCQIIPALANLEDTG